jgi:hypothetical protein
LVDFIATMTSSFPSYSLIMIDPKKPGFYYRQARHHFRKCLEICGDVRLLDIGLE